MKWTLMFAGLQLAMAACAQMPDAAAAPFCTATIHSYANPEAGARGDYSPNVLFANVAPSRNAVGYGAAGGRSDEITIADGVLHLARPDGAGGHAERRTAARGEGAYMLQLVNVGAWRDSALIDGAASLDALGAVVGAKVSVGGCTGPAKLAYRIEGRIRTAEWSLDTLPARGDFAAAGQNVVIVGLYANTDQAAHFVPEGRNIHGHIVFPALGVAGHLKAVELEPGSRLQLQAN